MWRAVPQAIACERSARCPPGASIQDDLGNDGHAAIEFRAERIAGATYVELPGRGSLLWSGDQDALLREIEHFVTGSRPAPRHDRVLATVLFTDIVLFS